jgi:hypothetical protein
MQSRILDNNKKKEEEKKKKIEGYTFAMERHVSKK